MLGNIFRANNFINSAIAFLQLQIECGGSSDLDNIITTKQRCTNTPK